MDLGCLDLCCIDKNSYDPTSGDRERSVVASPTTTPTPNARTGKSKMLKETGQSISTNGHNKIVSQVKKPPHRKNSPINWFPRKKVDSYLERKIKMMQEVDGMNLTLDETLDDSNPHYCRVLREKIAAREAAHKAVEARKAALVEASWCRILKAARIQRKEADIELEKAEKAAAEAVEAASALGVIMNDKTSCPQKPSRIEMSSKKGGEFTTLTVTASFVTPFEVDREVAAAVKAAFLHLASSSSFSKDEFKDLVQKISQNPDSNLTEYYSDCESALGSDQEKSPSKPVFQRKQKRRLSLEKLTKEKIVDMMVERLKCLHEDELSSLATIVATCGLNAALAEVGSGKIHEHNRRASSSCSSKDETDLLPSLDKFLVKHETKLEREVREAKSTNKNEVKTEAKGNENGTGDGNVKLELPGLEREVQEAKITGEEEANANPVTEIPSLDKILVKRVSRLEQEVLEARNKRKHDGQEASDAMKFKKRVSLDKLSEKENVNLNEEENEQSLDKIMIKPVSRLEKEKMLASTRTDYEYQKIQKKQTGDNCESLDKILVKPMSRLEREKMQALSSGSNNNYEYKKENVNLNEEEKEQSLDKIMIKPMSRLEKEKMLALSTRTDYQKSQKKQTGDDCESLDKILVKPMSRLEREKMQSLSSGSNNYEYKKKSQKKQTGDNCESLEQILVKPMSRLEKEKMQALSSGSNNYEYKKKTQMQPNADDSESLDKVLVKRVSRLDKEKTNLSSKEEYLPKVKTSEQDMNLQKGGGLEEILVKHKPRLERERSEAASQQPVEEIKVSVSRKQAREKQLQDSWGGLSLGNSMKPHLSKLEKDKAAWIQAEEEERKKA